jgi:NAD(P)-dependent dehydrogenase (short-subunit alcohol dehydrogenase family)
MDVKGKVVLITGASVGIGRAAALLFSREGAQVALSARPSVGLNDLAMELESSRAITADMSKPDEARRLVEETYAHFGRLDVLINNAGQGYISPVESIERDKFDALMSLNLYGPLAAMQAALPIMRKQGGGTIVNVSSKVTLTHIPNLSAYAATKAALNMLTLTARKELEPEGITVCLVYPGLTATDFRKNALRAEGMPMPMPAHNTQGDTAEKVAEKILEAVVTGAAEIIL